MRYFITGGAGFIGSNMVDRILSLDETNSVTVFDDLRSGHEEYLSHHMGHPNFTFVRGDLLELDAVKAAIGGHDFVFHFAANADIAKSMTDTSLDVNLSVITTYNVLEAMRVAGVRKIAYSSGSGVYGDVGDLATAEDFGPLLPISLYGAAKISAESLISAFCYMFDMQGWIFRFANVVGVRQTHGVVYDFVRRLLCDGTRLPIMGDGTQSKSYVDVTDVLDAMLFCIANAGETVNTFNAGTDDHITVAEIAQRVIRFMKLKDIELDFSGGDRGWKGDVPIVRLDLRKIHAVGWKARYTSAEAIERSIGPILSQASQEAGAK